MGLSLNIGFFFNFFLFYVSIKLHSYYTFLTCDWYFASMAATGFYDTILVSEFIKQHFKFNISERLSEEDVLKMVITIQ